MGAIMKTTNTALLHGFRVSWRKILWLGLLTLATLNPPAFLLAQNRPVKFERLGLEQGLSQSSARRILQDHQGFMWIGTQDGLNRYDGYNFTIYEHDVQDSSSISDNWITSIYEDRSGTLWIGTRGGLNKFNREKEQFTRFVNNPANPHSLSNNSIWSIYEDRSGTLWIGTSGGLNKFDREKEQFTRFVHDPNNPHSLSHNTVRSIYEDRSGTLWILTAGGLCQLSRDDRDTGQFIRFVRDHKIQPHLSRDIVTSVFEDHTKTLWIGTYNGLTRFDRNRGQFTRFVHDPNNPHSLSHNLVIPIHEDNTGVLWIGGEFGLNQFDRETEKFFRFVNDPKDPQSLGANGIWAIYEDRSGMLWLGTDGGGINRIDSERRQFTHFAHDPNNPHSLSHNTVRSIYEDRSGMLWVGTLHGGLNRVDRVKKQFTRFKNEPRNPYSLSNNRVWSIYEDRTGAFWIATSGGGLNRFDRSKEQFTHFVHDAKNPHSLSSNLINVIYEDHAGTLWIGTEFGLNQFDRETGKFFRFVNDPKNPNSLSQNYVFAIHEDHTGMLWIGTRGGLNRFDRRKGQFTRFHYDPKEIHSLSHNVISSICEDHAGVLWIGTSDGLNRFDRDKEQFTYYTEKDGLPNSYIYGILEDDHGRLWLSTNKGLSRFDPQTKKFRNYDVTDGLQGNEFNSGAYHKSRNGEMFFGGINGLTAFHPDSIKDNSYIPPVAITAFIRYNTDEAEGVAIAEKGISAKKEIPVSYKDNILAFEFAALNYRNTFKNQYAYKLEGYSDKWIRLGTKRDVTFTNLDPGEYTLRVKGSNNDGVWNEEGTSIKITITPPWWKTWWAYTLYVLMFAGIILGYIRYKTQAQAKELALKNRELQQERQVTERLRQVDKLKDDFLANTSHELRTPLHGIIGLAESSVADSSVTLPKRMQANLGMIIASGKRLASLVNDILDFSKLKTHHLDIQKKPIDMRVLVDLVLKFSESLVAGKKLILKNEIPADLPPVEGDENRLQQVLHNLVGNAIKFTESGEVKISAAQRNGMVEISVADTGIGISKDKQQDIFKSFEQVDTSISREYGGTGLGLAITKSLVELHGGKIWVESEAARGAVFTFTLPVSKGKPEALVKTIDLARVRDVGRRAWGEEREATSSDSYDQRPSPFPLLPSAQNGAFHILIVDDEPVNQQVLANHLTLGKYRFSQAYNGEEALRAIDKTKFDLILLDVMMPRMSGYEVCQRLRKKYLPAELPVIMVTAKDQVQDLIEGLSSGANDYLAKPFSKDELLARIKTHLNLLKINTAFGRFVPREFLRYLEKESAVDVKLGDHTQMEVTIFVSDIRGFTTISEKMTPAENFAFINEYFSIASPTVREHHGFVDRYTGDAIMALFPRQAEDAVNNSIATFKRIRAFNTEREKIGKPAINIGVGLHSGNLMLGIVGEQERMQGDIFSDAVNLTNRIEGLCKFYGASIVVSEITLNKLANRSDYHTRFLGKVQVKGKDVPISLFEVYNGDPEPIIELKLKTKGDFESGLHRYFEKEFTEASVCFNKVLKVNPADKTARLYLERSAQFMVKGVAEDWEGVEAMESK